MPTSHSRSSATFPRTKLNISFPEFVRWESSEDRAATPVFLASQNILGYVKIQGHDADILSPNTGILRVEFLGMCSLQPTGLIALSFLLSSLGTYSARRWTSDSVTGELRDLETREQKVIYYSVGPSTLL